MQSEGAKGTEGGSNSAFDNKMNKHLVQLILDKFRNNKQAQNMMN